MQKCNTFFGHILFTYENGPQTYKLYTMALGDALELQRLSNNALKHHLLPPTVHIDINVLQAMVNEETSHGTHLFGLKTRHGV